VKETYFLFVLVHVNLFDATAKSSGPLLRHCYTRWKVFANNAKFSTASLRSQCLSAFGVCLEVDEAQEAAHLDGSISSPWSFANQLPGLLCEEEEEEITSFQPHQAD